ncbi:ferric reductase-like transmembrane domain-containing protein [Tsuneonella sp. SYSU-LHT278]|uniref:ferric reductase-like transmembrane domain-containing protein n=1 Tax=Tsuneonella sediminis TaxID=3416089 RepID=UPI003F79A87D
MKRIGGARLLLWVALALPGAWIGWRWLATPETYGFGHAIRDSGDWAAWLLLAALAVTPLRLALGMRPLTRWLLLRRRDLGVASFAYAAAHTGIYLADKASLAVVFDQAGGADLLTGWLALALFAPLAATSNDASVRAFKRAWKSLHRLVYPAALLVFAHWVLTAFDPFTAWLHVAILALIEGARIALQYRQGRRQRVT